MRGGINVERMLHEVKWKWKRYINSEAKVSCLKLREEVIHTMYPKEN